jgi:hypothetical protein
LRIESWGLRVGIRSDVMGRGIGNRQKKIVAPKKVWIQPPAPAKPALKGRREKPVRKRD